MAKILKKKRQLSDLLSEFVIFPEIGCPVMKVENFYCQFFSCSTEQILADFEHVVKKPSNN